MSDKRVCQQQDRAPGNKILFPGQRRCIICQKEFVPWKSRKDKAKYCSRKCWAMGMTKPRIVCFCDQCGRKFKRRQTEVRETEKHFCSQQCHLSFNRNHAEAKLIQDVRCDFCGKAIKKSNKTLRRYKHKFCNLSCSMRHTLTNSEMRFRISQAARLPKSEEWKKKNRAAHQGQWESDNYASRTLAGYLFGRGAFDRLDEFQKEIIRAKVLLFNLNRRLKNEQENSEGNSVSVG